MTRIRATCPDCGEVDLVPADVTLHVVPDEDGEAGPGSCYRFSCPECEEPVTKPADERIAQLLASGGVEVETSEADALHGHPEEPRGGPAFTADDLIDFHLLLSRDDWFQRLLSLTS